jgi:hypothetical protein
MNLQMQNIQLTGRDGRVTALEHCFIRGSKVCQPSFSWSVVPWCWWCWDRVNGWLRAHFKRWSCHLKLFSCGHRLYWTANHPDVWRAEHDCSEIRLTCTHARGLCDTHARAHTHYTRHALAPAFCGTVPSRCRCDSSFYPTCSRTRPCSNGLIQRPPPLPPLVDAVRAEARSRRCERRVGQTCHEPVPHPSPSRRRPAPFVCRGCCVNCHPLDQSRLFCSEGKGCGWAMSGTR